MRKVRTALLVVGCLVAWSSSTSSQPIPSPLQGITIATRVSKDQTTGIFTFDYRVTNPPVNNGEIRMLALEITRSPTDATLSREGLVNGPRYLFNLSEDAFQRVAMVPVGISAPEGWGSGLGISREDGPPGLAMWGSLDSAARIRPGSAREGYRLTSYGLPGIRAAEIRPGIDWDNLPDEFDENVEKSRALQESLLFRTSSVGPKAPPQNFVPIDFLNYLITLVHDSQQLGWIREADEQRNLLQRLTDAKRRLEANEPVKAAKRIERFLKRVQEKSCPDFSCRDEKDLTSEAFALLFFNGRFLLDRLPKPPAEPDDDERDG